jgi:hypothetical protein
MVREDPVCPTDEDDEAMSAGIVPGARIRRRRRQPDLARLVPLADLLEQGHAIEDHPIEPGQLFSRAPLRIARGMRGWR